MPGLSKLQWLVPGICALFLAGCNPFSEARPMMTEYLERLARVLEAPAVSLPEELPPASQLPRRRDRVLDMPELDIGMLEFLSLYGCELQYVVGEKNSVMGKVMQPVNRLRYEVRFIRAAEDCLPEVDDEELGETLAEAIESKQDSLPRAVWNATWGTEEIENLFTLSKGFYPVGEGQLPVSDLLRDLEQLNEMVTALSRQQLDVPLDNLGAIHQRWQAEYRAGQLVNSARLLIATLDTGTEVLQARLAERPLCLNGKPNNQSDIVHSFFFSVYIGEVQPYMSDVSRAADTLIAGFAELAAKQEAQIPEAFGGWARRHLQAGEEGSLWHQLDGAMMRHTRHWQQLLEQCGLRPGA
ncbi:DUF3080 domain-containing protein [Marinobacter vinifirmus]|uniref:DUF3080 domain-containing protein n=1 Tax=Marinobacter vinifirmus TaxID=355591 RepID=A0A558B9U1_9GAMM|nr:DUF3080 domain-containing protein [Marinobacter vinifirmus]TVT33260.1 MAG: DUF3080 domain-containing protein [Marinobacter vinifirmus]